MTPQPPGQLPAGQMPPVHYSPDGRFVWNGYAWVPVQPPSNTGRNVAAVIGIGCLVLLILAILAIVGLTIVGKQVTNVFSNISPYFPNDSNSFNFFSNISNGLGQ